MTKNFVPFINKRLRIYDQICKKGVIHASNFVSLKIYNLILSELLGQIFQSYTCNDRTVLLPNFKAVGQTQAELHSLKVEKLDACIRPLFTNLVTYKKNFFRC